MEDSQQSRVCLVDFATGQGTPAHHLRGNSPEHTSTSKCSSSQAYPSPKGVRPPRHLPQGGLTKRPMHSPPAFYVSKTFGVMADSVGGGLCLCFSVLQRKRYRNSLLLEGRGWRLHSAFVLEISVQSPRRDWGGVRCHVAKSTRDTLDYRHHQNARWAVFTCI